MSRRNENFAETLHSGLRPFRPELELLESRCLLNADPVSLATDLIPAEERVLVAQEAAEEDYTVHIAVVPNDSYFGQLSGLHNTGQTVAGVTGVADRDIDAVEAWDQFGARKGSTSVVVGILDSGIDYTHEDLYLNVWINPEEIPSAIRSRLTDVDADGVLTFWDLNDAINIGTNTITDLNANGRIDGGDILRPVAEGGWADGIDQDPFTTRGITYRYTDDLIGWNFVENTNDPLDDNGHGTHVAGTIGAIGNNGVGVTGVNWVSQLAALKFLNGGGSGMTSDAATALDYAVGNGMRVTNNSWSGGGYSSTLEAAIRNARDHNQIFVAAAGNEGSDNDSIASYPTAFDLANVVAVAATDNRDALASFSNRGATTVDLAAPGVSVLSTTPSNASNPNGNYSYYSGTSMATPHVAGAAALLLAKSPTLTYAQVISQLTGSVDVVAGLSGMVRTGGRLNLNGALSEITPASDTSGAQMLSATILGSQNAVTGVQITFSEDIKSGTFTTADITELTGFATRPTITVKRVDARTYNLLFSTPQTRAGNYSLTIGPSILDLSGNTMNQNQDGTNGQRGSGGDAARVTFSVAGTTQTFTNSTVAAIRDYQTTSSSIVINQALTIADLNVRVNLKHTYVGDLRLQLLGPDGTTIRLFNYRGGSGDNLNGTVFDDEAGSFLSAGKAPFQGSYRPEVALSGFDGKSLAGTWTLQVYDSAGGDIGSLTSWSLIVTTSSNGGTVTGRSVLADPVEFAPEMPDLLPPGTIQEAVTTTTTDIGLAIALVSNDFTEAVPVEAPAPTRRVDATGSRILLEYESADDFPDLVSLADGGPVAETESATEATDRFFVELVEALVE